MDTVCLWGKNWTRGIGPIRTDINSETGFLVEEYENTDVGGFALMCIPPEQINIKNKEKFFSAIREKTDEGKPYIIWENEVHLEECRMWNDGNNTTCRKEDFESIINT
jgi:hypothetical protein